MALKTTFITDGSAPHCAPNPAHPNGLDADASRGAAKTCTTALQYPAPSRGLHIIECSECGLKLGATAAGRPDDPKSIKVACRVAGDDERTHCARLDCRSGKPGRWQVGFRLWCRGSERKDEFANRAFTTMCVCDDCCEVVKIEDLLTPESQARIAHQFGAAGIPVPDFDTAEVTLTEVVLGKPMSLRQMVEDVPAEGLADKGGLN